MNRPSARQVVAVGLVLVALGGVSAGVRIADVGHPYPAGDAAVDTDQPPREVIQQSGRLLNVVDHRLVTRVYVESENERSLRAEYRHVREFSNREHLAVYDVYPTPGLSPAANRSTQFHSRLAFFHAGIVEGPGRTILYATDGGFVTEVGVGGPGGSSVYEPDSNEPARFVDPLRTADVTPRDIREAYGDVFVPHDAAWREVSRANGTVTYAIDDPDQQFETRPVPLGANLLEGSEIRVTLDARTGRLQSIEERRVLRYGYTVREGPDQGEYRETTVTYVVETDVDRYGTAEVERPSGANPTIEQLFADLLRY
jgi:hypothetical protein